MNYCELDAEQRAALVGGEEAVREQKSADKIRKLVRMGGEIA